MAYNFDTDVMRLLNEPDDEAGDSDAPVSDTLDELGQRVTAVSDRVLFQIDRSTVAPPSGGLTTEAAVHRALAEVLAAAPIAGTRGLGAGTVVEGVMPPGQAVLAYQVKTACGDMKRISDGLELRSRVVDEDDFIATRAAVHDICDALIEIVDAVDGPMNLRFSSLLFLLVGSFAPGEPPLGRLGRLIALATVESVDFIRSDAVDFVTASDEVQRAQVKLLEAAANQLVAAWNGYAEADLAAEPDYDVSFSTRISRTALALGAAGETVTNLIDAMDGLGYTATERRITKVDIGYGSERPMTASVADILAWAGALTRRTEPSLREIGIPLLERITLESRVLSATLKLLLDQTRRGSAVPLPAALKDHRVRDEIATLRSQLIAAAEATGVEFRTEIHLTKGD